MDTGRLSYGSIEKRDASTVPLMLKLVPFPTGTDHEAGASFDHLEYATEAVETIDWRR